MALVDVEVVVVDITKSNYYTTYMPDIDIDLADRNVLLEKVKHTKASIIKDEVKPHNTGVYFTDCPQLPNSNQCSLDYKHAESLGYFKIDLLNVNIYSLIENRVQLQKMFERQPPWHRLNDKTFVDQLFHLNGHHDTVSKLMPQNLEQLAACLAIIRPAKRHLIGKSWSDILNDVWTKPTDGQYYFKKAHAFSYAGAVIVHMNLLDSAD